MSELPSFKEGLIFDTRNRSGKNDGSSKTEPIIITGDLPCLFKINDADYYNKNCTFWYVYSFVYDNSLSITTSLDNVGKNIDVCSDLSFCNTPTSKFVNVIKWNGGIYVFINPNSYTGRVSFQNGKTYRISIQRYTDDRTTMLGTSFPFYIRTEFNYPSCTYNNDNISFGNYGYEITLTNPVTTIDWSYNANGSTDILKYYQFSLYNSQNKCVVDTGKVYTDTTNGNGFVCNSLDDESQYTLIGYCVSQSGQRIDFPDLIIKTKYTTGKIYANLTIELDKHLAKNNITAKVTSIIGEAKDENNIVFIDSEKLDLKNNDNNVLFRYDLPTNNFLIRLWINGIKESNEKITILKLSNNDDYIELYYENGYFYAIKHSYGLASQYMSNSISNVLNANTYLSLLYCNGRIDIYASNYE